MRQERDLIACRGGTEHCCRVPGRAVEFYNANPVQPPLDSSRVTAKAPHAGSKSPGCRSCLDETATRGAHDPHSVIHGHKRTFSRIETEP